jgi:enoyl-CoA hydratase/carnithine racemase
MSTDTTTAVRYERDAEGIVTLILDDPNQSANTMNELYIDSMNAAVERLYEEADDVKGVVITSAKETFFAGGDLKRMIQAQKEDAPQIFSMAEGVKSPLRKLEQLGKPVVAAINGAALGGGLEIALAANHRIAADGKYKIGLPEATLGLLPGGGGVTRTVRMFGIQDALMNVLLQGTQFNPDKALATGLIDELVPAEELLAKARAWVVASFEQSDVRSLLAGERVYFPHTPTARNIKNLIRNAVLAFRLLRRCRPKAIVSTGAAVAVPFAWVGRLLGIRVVWVESLARTTKPSLSCRLVAPISDRVYVQWPTLAGVVPNGRFGGTVFWRR